MNIKGVIIAAGYGTRLLPFTKTVSKELAPLGIRPSIDYIIREFVNAGLKDIVVITSRQKRDLENYFDHNFEIETFLKQKGKEKELEAIKNYDINVFFVRQKCMRGTGDALLLTKPLLEGHTFVVAFPDDIDPTLSLTSSLIDMYKKTNLNVLSGFTVEKKDVSRYGIIKPDGNKVCSIVEKPSIEDAPSNIASMGRYLFTSEVFDELEEAKKYTSPDKEFFMTDAIERLAKKNKVVYVMAEKRLDTGSPDAYIKSFLEIVYIENKDIFVSFANEKGFKHV